jgi:hypothetical protein
VKKLLLLFLLIPAFAIAQKTALVKGFVKNKQNEFLEGVTVSYGSKGTTKSEFR